MMYILLRCHATVLLMLSLATQTMIHTVFICCALHLCSACASSMGSRCKTPSMKHADVSSQ